MTETRQPKGIRVIATDLVTGETQTAEVMDSYVLLCAGSAHLDSAQVHSNGTVQITIKGVRQ